MKIKSSFEYQAKKPLIIFKGSLITALVIASTSICASDNYQRNLLFKPGHDTLQAEAKGRVMIYDGLKSETVDQALDEQFGRIQNMMFVRTRYVQDNGDYEVEDDGCD